jgi:hypothetical protein
MSAFQQLVVGSLVVIAGSTFAIACQAAAIQKDIAEIWKRLKRID